MSCCSMPQQHAPSLYYPVPSIINCTTSHIKSLGSEAIILHLFEGSPARCLGQSPVAGHACRTLRKNIRIVNSSAALHPVNPRSAPACRQKICKANPVTQGGLCPLLVQVCTSERDNVQGFRELERGQKTVEVFPEFWQAARRPGLSASATAGGPPQSVLSRRSFHLFGLGTLA